MSNKVSLYNKHWRYTDVASAIDQEANKALEPIFKKYRELGCSPREMAHVMCATITDLELMAVLDWDEKPNKQEQN